MKQFISSRLIIASLFVLIMISAIFVFATNQSRKEFQLVSDDVRVDNKTKSLIVESLMEIRKQDKQTDLTNRTDYRTFEVKLKNSSEKPIVYFSLLTRDASANRNSGRSSIERGAATDEWSLLPNEVDVNRFSAAPEGEVVLTIAAVLFDDGTEEGEPDELLRLRDMRAGMKQAYQQIVPILKRNSNQNQAVDSNSAIQSLEKEIASISDENVPMNQKGGFRQAKNFFITEIKDLKTQTNNKSSSDSSFVYSSKVAKQLARIERTIARF